MREAVIVSTARTPIGKAYRGAFNDTQPQQMAARAVSEAVKRAGIEPGEVEEVVIGAALQEGGQGFNVARQVALAAGLPVTAAGMTVDRQCSSGLMAIAAAAKEVILDGVPIAVADGACSTIMAVHNSVACMPILRHGNDAQRARFLGPLARGELLGAFALTEPQAGSDASALRTRARPSGNGYVLDGTKQFITSGSQADLVIT